MNSLNQRPISEDEIARVAREIWEAEGRPEGRHEAHWQRAREILEAGNAQDHAPRPVQPGFTDTPPGMVPDMKPNVGSDELREDAGGRFAKQVHEAPETPDPRRSDARPGRTDPPKPFEKER